MRCRERERERERSRAVCGGRGRGGSAWEGTAWENDILSWPQILEYDIDDISIAISARNFSPAHATSVGDKTFFWGALKLESPRPHLHQL